MVDVGEAPPPADVGVRPAVLGAPRYALEASRSRLRMLVVLIALLGYGGYAAGTIASEGAASFAHVGSGISQTDGASPELNARFHAVAGLGYDGQFAYAIALDPSRARGYMDLPAYRYSHIAYPLLARSVAFGQPRWVAGALILVNLVAVVGGAAIVATLLGRRGVNPLFALLYVGFPGLMLSFADDLCEPVAFAFVGLGLLLLDDWRSPNRVMLAGASFALAGLTRETTLLIPVILALTHALARSRPGGVRRAAALVALTTVPYMAWRLFLLAWLGGTGATPMTTVDALPFGGLRGSIDLWPFLAVAVPTGLLLAATLPTLAASWRQGTTVALTASLVALGLYLPAETYYEYRGAGRLQIGTVMLALLAISSLRGNRWTSLLARTGASFAYLPLLPLLAAAMHKLGG